MPTPTPTPTPPDTGPQAAPQPPPLPPAAAWLAPSSTAEQSSTEGAIAGTVPEGASIITGAAG